MPPELLLAISRRRTCVRAGVARVRAAKARPAAPHTHTHIARGPRGTNALGSRGHWEWAR